MTIKQHEAISRKLTGVQPTELRPLLEGIDGLLQKEIAIYDASKLMDAIYTIHANDRNRRIFSDDWNKEQNDCVNMIEELIEKYAN